MIINNTILILLAGGAGKRLNNEINKPMISYNNVTILEMNIINFKKYLDKILIQVVTNKKDFFKVSVLCKKYNILTPIIGGNERHKSVYNGLLAISNFNPKYVIIHDTARPIISSEVIKKIVAYSKKEIFCVVPVIKINDAIRTISSKIIEKTVKKQNKVLVQTPQLSNYQILRRTLEKSKKKFEDESELFLDNSMKVIAIEGDPLTLKITYEKDLNLLEPYLSMNDNTYVTKIGNGFDVHRFDNSKNLKKNFIVIGGIKIEHSKPLIGHSDADVLLHAITDSILGAINKGDIGFLFPPTEKKWENANSSVFLKHASNLLKNERGKINNIDAIIICEKPKILDYSNQMKENIAKLLNINKHKISIKGKTSESIGFIGRQEGIAAMVSTAIQIRDNTFNE